MASAGEFVWIDDGAKARPALVVRVLADGRLYVLFGTKTNRGTKCIEVHPLHRVGKALGLDFPTYFYPKPAIVRPAAVERGGARCPPRLFLDAEEMLGVIKAPALARPAGKDEAVPNHATEVRLEQVAMVTQVAEVAPVVPLMAALKEIDD